MFCPILIEYQPSVHRTTGSPGATGETPTDVTPAPSMVSVTVASGTATGAALDAAQAARAPRRPGLDHRDGLTQQHSRIV
jgi:hypothetical protein